jgi:uncharacterized membrane protein YjgN (DUF898 family)
MSIPSPAAVQPSDGEVSVACTARVWPAMWLALRLTLLKLVTLYVYRFWAETRVRRFLWLSVVINGDRVEYTGTGGELFRGGLVAIALIGAVSIVSSLLGTLTEGFSLVFWLTIIPALFIITIFSFHSWRYRVRKTIWRGLAFGFDAKYGGYWTKAFKYACIVILSAGFAYPIYALKTKRWLIDRTAFGTAPLVRHSEAAPGVWAWYLAGWGCIVCAGVGAIALGVTTTKDGLSTTYGINPALSLLILLGAVFLMFYSAALTRALWSGVSIAGVRIDAHFSLLRHVWIQVSYFAVIAVLTIGVIALFLGALIGTVLLTSGSAAKPFDIGTWLAFLPGFAVTAVALLLVWSLHLPLLRVRLLRLVISSLVVEGTLDLDAVRQRADWNARTGSIGDALDLAV